MDIPEGETELARILKSRIRANGPMSFHDFMAAALYEPGLGYYARGPDIGPTGDFSTSVKFEAFRLAVHRYAEAVWRALDEPNTFRIVELGGGTGQLAETVTSAWRAAHPDVALDYVTVDASASLRERQAAHPGVRAVARTDELEPAPGLVFGNEVLDALPVERVMGGREGLMRIVIDVHPESQRFRERLLPYHDEAMARRFERIGIRPVTGQICEFAPGLDAFVQDAARLVSRGVLTFVDYGDPARVLYAPTRLNGTLAAYRGHGKFYDPYERVGEQDLTTDVDFSTVTFAAEDAGLKALGLITQQEWLESLGIHDLGLPDDVRTVAGAASLGTTFHVLAFRRGITATPPGF